MLSTFLSQLQTYFSKYFIVGNFFPVLAFAFANGMAAYFVFEPWHSLIETNLFSASTTRSAFFTFSLLVAIVLAAYVLSALSTFLRQLLEGRWWQPLATIFIPAQKARRERLLDGIKSEDMNIIDLRDAREWENDLVKARETGKSNYQRLRERFDGKLVELKDILDPLDLKHQQSIAITAADLQPAVSKMKALINDYGADFMQEVNSHLNQLTQIIDYAQLDNEDRWKKQLRAASKIADERRKRKVDHQKKQLEAHFTPLDTLRAKDETIPATDFEACRQEMSELLKNNNVDSHPFLDLEHSHLLQLIKYADERAHARKARLQNEVNSNFGAQEIAPTKMGNVANTIQSYALRRYHCNLEIIWSNLQRVVQSNEKAQAALQESKAQLDFLVACCWLTLLSSAIWVLVLGVYEQSRLEFLLVGLGGPLISYAWYRAAAEQYRSFADVAMTTLDTFRFELLRDLHLRIPTDVEDERFIWDRFNDLTTYGVRQNFQYFERDKRSA